MADPFDAIHELLRSDEPAEASGRLQGKLSEVTEEPPSAPDKPEAAPPQLMAPLTVATRINRFHCVGV